MKKLLLLTCVVLTFSALGFAQKTFHVPESGKSIIDISVPMDKWNVSNEDGLFSLTPNDTGETSRLITMVWASEDPYSETAIDDITTEAFDVVESLLVDIEWAEEISEFDSNGIAFVANDGYGYYENEDGTRDQMSTTIMLFMPDDVNIMTLVFFGTNEAYDKWEESLLEVILSMTPSK